MIYYYYYYYLILIILGWIDLVLVQHGKTFIQLGRD